MPIATDRRTQLVTVAETYFRGLAQKDMSQVPWHPDVIFRGPLAPAAPEPLGGSTAVRLWFEGLYPALDRVEVFEHYVDEAERSIATRADVHLTRPPSVLRVIDRFVVDAAGLIVEQENHYDPRPALQPAPGVMTAQERDLLSDLLVSSQHALISAIVRLTVDQWSFNPGEGRWSIAECAEHIAAAEPMIRSMIAESMKQDLPVDQVGGAHMDDMIKHGLVDRSKKFKAPEPLIPTNRFKTPEGAIEAFKKERAETIALAGGDVDLRARGSKHFIFGPLDAYGWFLFQSGHSERHTLQIEEVKTTPGYPK